MKKALFPLVTWRWYSVTLINGRNFVGQCVRRSGNRSSFELGERDDGVDIITIMAFTLMREIASVERLEKNQITKEQTAKGMMWRKK